ncbi:hypothetical protein EH223_19410 [candidate division KSB1 bacterium]|nr:hypothetical protein [candidate division KSB1 bacterium]RQW00116.1 MAG: hypothetical protein EH223_19410 [candidate division KSB1 bacterium]
MRFPFAVFFALYASHLLFSQVAHMWVSCELYPENPIWFTQPPDTSDIRYKLTPAHIVCSTTQSSNAEIHSFTLRAQETDQTLFGIGTSLEETTVYAIRKNKNEKEIRDILRALIDPEKGIGMNLFRITIGTSDFSDARTISTHPQGFYSYQDHIDDKFSIQNDLDLGIIDVLKLALEVAGECEPPQQITFFASCWSPPPWMKTSGSLIGGTLKKGYESKLALYFRKFIQAYQSHGIPISAMTIQNESNFTPETYPGMRLTWQRERDLVIAIYEEFQRHPKINTKLWIIDHNFEYWKKADKILTSLAKMGKKSYVDAVAFHDYSSAPASNMRKLQKRHPGINVQFSEMSKYGVRGMVDIQNYFWNGAQSYVYWVTMSTQNPAEHNQGPYNNLRMLSPTLLIKTDGDNPDWYFNADYYLLGQFSRFIRPGAVRIECDRGTPESLTAVAFQNPENDIVIVFVNQTERSQPFQIIHEGHFYTSDIPAQSVGTVKILPLKAKTPKSLEQPRKAETGRIFH